MKLTLSQPLVQMMWFTTALTINKKEQMSYRRFLVDSDYLPVLTEEHMKQLIRDVHDRLPMVEQSAEMNMLEFLDQFYEIEKELQKGKSLAYYLPTINYPAGAYFVYNDRIYRALVAINGRKVPTETIYWELADDNSYIDAESIEKYSQLKTYYVGSMVKFGADVWRCTNPNGYEFNNIQVPGVIAWRTLEVNEWEPNVEYSVSNVVKYNGNYYMLSSTDEIDLTISPDESNNWGLIGEYSENYKYDYTQNTTDYVVSNGKVFYPIINPNADEPVVGVNITPDDPRNINVVTHMVRLSVYYLHQLISPTNISETRRAAYEDSMNWLLLASKFKLNPQIPRKISKEDGHATTDWALSTYQKSFNPYENPWLI